MKKKPAPKPLIFDLDNETFSEAFLVVVGGTKLDTLRYLKRVKARKEWLEAIAESDDAFEIVEQGANACFWWRGKAKFILLSPYTDDWDYWETLMHECVHAMQWMGREHLMAKEDEALARIHEWLFRSIRKKLQAKYK